VIGLLVVCVYYYYSHTDAFEIEKHLKKIFIFIIRRRKI